MVPLNIIETLNTYASYIHDHVKHIIGAPLIVKFLCKKVLWVNQELNLQAVDGEIQETVTAATSHWQKSAGDTDQRATENPEHMHSMYVSWFTDILVRRLSISLLVHINARIIILCTRAV